MTGPFSVRHGVYTSEILDGRGVCVATTAAAGLWVDGEYYSISDEEAKVNAECIAETLNRGVVAYVSN